MPKLNESGYTMILVLLTITIIGIMVPPIMSSIMNSSSQYNESEENIQRKKLMDMGTIRIEKKVELAVEEAEDIVERETKEGETQDPEDRFFNLLQNRLPSSEETIVLQDGGEQFILSHGSPSPSGGGITVSYEVTPSLDGGGKEAAKLQDTVTVNVSLAER
ncbi:hypothetical protein [Salibacterium halotolerans]|uniref:Type II secretory pathway, pseudopilin PulG n=1 Tax=Salibacterium halotolerans TaxID=1884432 RepID=A0A1I5WRT7_9BACI|nr:hypothetical protein [Salibacterium halotolerans]SFQ22311.1 Type II secretory pathway, pseudopilin PulG [Salibacterium halotolerans]